jgi:hypothetical protein
MKSIGRITWKANFGRQDDVQKTDAAAAQRAARYFSKSEQYNKAAADMGYLSFEAAIRAGKMKDILERAGAAPSTEKRPSK